MDKYLLLSWIDPKLLNNHGLCLNKSFEAGEILKNNLKRIDFILLSQNPSEWAGRLLRDNLKRIDYECLSENPSEWVEEILRYWKKYRWHYLQNLAEKKYHPDRLFKQGYFNDF
jgi:hypothetical protein